MFEEGRVMKKKCGAEFVGTFWLVFAGCGSALLAAEVPVLGIGYLGVSLAFGLSVATMIYALGPISGGHFNPAVSIGLWVEGRFAAHGLFPYIASQVLGAIAAAIALYLVASGKPGFSTEGGFASNGYGANSPGGYSLLAGFVLEVILTAGFLIVILCVGALRNSAAGLAPLAIGLALTLIHLISIPVTNTSVNPARSTGVALIQGGWAMSELWMFWSAPIIGAVLGALVYRVIDEEALPASHC
jgi:aquaporin Z